MALITKPKTFVDNEKLLYTDLNSLMDTIYNEFNGSISNTNIASDAAIATTKISGTAVTLNGVETLTNKTLTSPTVNTPTLTLADATTLTTDGGIKYDRTNEDLLVGDGTNTQKMHMGAYKTWTPTWSGAVTSIGNATVSGRYHQSGKKIHVILSCTFGSGSTFGAGNITFTLPVTATGAFKSYGHVDMLRSTTNVAFGTAYLASTTTAILFAYNSAGTYVVPAIVTNTVPQTWTNGDIIQAEFTYEAA